MKKVEHITGLRYLKYGMVWGSVFFLIVIGFDFVFGDSGSTLVEILDTQRRHPIYWFVDLSPLWGGLVAYAVGCKHGISLDVLAQSYRERIVQADKEKKVHKIQGPFHALLAERDALNAVWTQRSLENMGGTVTVVYTVNEVLNRLRRDDLVDLILLDLDMPGIDAGRLNAQMQAQASNANTAVPVVALGTGLTACWEERYSAAGIAAYLDKPVDREQLDAVVCRLVSKENADNPFRDRDGWLNEVIRNRRTFSDEERVQSTPMAKKDLRRVVLHNADLRGAHLEGVLFNSSLLIGCCFREAVLRQADFSSAHLDGVDFSGADLRGARFSWTVLWNTDFSGADLAEATLDFAKLDHTNFEGAHLRDTEINGINLEHALGLTRDQLQRARVNLKTTQLPS
jgi:uncharacterized protein YjbI with pentapeptide repeats